MYIEIDWFTLIRSPTSDRVTMTKNIQSISSQFNTRDWRGDRRSKICIAYNGLCQHNT